MLYSIQNIKNSEIEEEERRSKKEKGKKLKKKLTKLANQLIGPFNKIQLMVYQKVINKSDF